MVYIAMEKERYLFNALLYHIYLNNFILLVLLEMNSSIIRSYSIFSNNSLSSDIWAKSVSLCCNIVEHKYDFNSFNLEKLHSADATVTGMVNRTLYAILALGKELCRFRNFRIFKGGRWAGHLGRGQPDRQAAARCRSCVALVRWLLGRAAGRAQGTAGQAAPPSPPYHGKSLGNNSDGQKKEGVKRPSWPNPRHSKIFFQTCSTPISSQEIDK
jgi:hypothetical protein